jgi:hypothetical protein
MAGYIRQPCKRSEALQQQSRNSEGGAVPVAQPPLLESCTADCWVTHMQLDQRNGFVALVLSTMTYWRDGTGTMSRKTRVVRASSRPTLLGPDGPVTMTSTYSIWWTPIRVGRRRSEVIRIDALWLCSQPLDMRRARSNCLQRWYRLWARHLHNTASPRAPWPAAADPPRHGAATHQTAAHIPC